MNYNIFQVWTLLPVTLSSKKNSRGRGHPPPIPTPARRFAPRTCASHMFLTYIRFYLPPWPDQSKTPCYAPEIYTWQFCILWGPYFGAHIWGTSFGDHTRGPHKSQRVLFLSRSTWCIFTTRTSNPRLIEGLLMLIKMERSAYLKVLL